MRAGVRSETKNKIETGFWFLLHGSDAYVFTELLEVYRAARVSMAKLRGLACLADF